MRRKFLVLALTVVVSGSFMAPRASGGVEMVEPENAPTARYNYEPAPERVYYAPPVVSVVAYPVVGYYPRPFGYYRYRRFYGHRSYWRGGHHWR